MKVTEHLANASEPVITFEIIPPTRGGSLNSLLAFVEDLAQHRPPFIDITSHAAEIIYEDTETGIRRRITRKRPGTLGVCALIQNKFNIDAVPHVLCEGFTREETEDFLIELHYLGIDNLMALRGDSTGHVKQLDGGRTRNEFAVDLIEQVQAMNRGRFLEDVEDASPTGFCIGAAGYPEKHFEAPNLAVDIRRLKQKVDAGAEYIVTQMFFDNQHHFRFVDECRSQGIDVPIIPGLKIITGANQVRTIPRTFHCEIPEPLADEVEANPDHAREVGIAWTIEQTRELLEWGAPAVHFYVMANSKAVNAVINGLDR